MADALERCLETHPRIKRARVRASTGSIILETRPELSPEALTGAVRIALEEIAAGKTSPVPPKSTRPNGNAAGDKNADRPVWHAMPAAEVARRLRTDPLLGLNATEAADRLLRCGPNCMPAEERRSQLALLAEQFKSLPVGMLTASAVVSLATGGVADAIATMAVVGLNAVFGYVTEGQAESAIHALIDTSSQTVRILRDGAETVVKGADLVPGDILLVRPGTLIPADARLTEAIRLSVDESALTGETLPVEKHPGLTAEPSAPLGARPSMLHAGTIVAAGNGMAIVVATGRETTTARITLLSRSTERPRAPVEAELDRLGTRLVQASLVACGLFFSIGVLRGYAFSTMLKDALALSVASVPEGLPVVATTTMALGLRQMERKGVLIRHIDAIESLGAIQTICLDKTGTLTQNRMKVVAAVAGLSEVALDDGKRLKVLAEAAALNNDGELDGGEATGSSSTEHALLKFALDCGIHVSELREARKRKATMERRPGQPWMTTLHRGGAPAALVKGAPEAVLAQCDTISLPRGVVPLDNGMRDRIRQLNGKLAAKPARIIAFASRNREAGDGETGGFTWLGLVAMADPLRNGAKEFVAQAQAAGIDTVIITGDQAATAGALARDLDLARGKPVKIVDSTELADLDPALLAALARRAHVFARVSPHQKLAIVQALQAAGRTVAMTGDGLNDGPALRAANVGIAMGASGTDLARDIANVVIRDDQLTTLINAIAQGRSVYKNIRRALKFLIATNMSEIAVSMVEALHGPGEIETPMELLWINLATDVLPGLGLALAAPEEDVMRQQPRSPKEGIIPKPDLLRMGGDSAIIAASALIAHFAGVNRHGPGPQTRGMTFLSLSLGQLLYTLVCQRNDPRKLHPERIFENKPLDLAILISSGFVVLPFFVPPLGRLLGIAPLRSRDAALSIATAIIPFASVLARRGIQFKPEEIEVPK
jgi:Ca2+-transporting ATPase